MKVLTRKFVQRERLSLPMDTVLRKYIKDVKAADLPMPSFRVRRASPPNLRFSGRGRLSPGIRARAETMATLFNPC